jgi:hypothetical protein
MLSKHSLNNLFWITSQKQLTQLLRAEILQRIIYK